MYKFIAAAIICLLPSMITVSAATSGREETTAIPGTFIARKALSQWQLPASGAVSLNFDPQGGAFGKGALVIQINQSAGIVEIKGPEITLPARDHSVSKRLLKLDLSAKLQNMADASVQIRFQQRNGFWARSCNPHRDWDTIIDLLRPYEWKNWTAAAESGIIANSTTSGRLVLRIDTASGKGRMDIDKLKLTEICTINHGINSDSTDNVFFAEQGKIKVTWFKPEMIKSGELLVRNEEQQTVLRQSFNPSALSAEIILPQRGYYDISVSAEYQDGSALFSSQSAAVVGPSIPDAVRKSSRYGIMRVHAGTEWAVKLGAALDWGFWNLDAIQPGPDGKLINRQAGSRPSERKLFYLAGMNGVLPPWLRSKKCKGWQLLPPRDWNKFAEAVELWAKTSPDLPDVVTVYNEPDAHWQGDDDGFVKFHQVVAMAVKKGSPNTPVGGPCMYGIRMKDFKRYVNKGILENMDAVVMHAYVNGTPPEEEFIDRIAELQDYLKTTKYAPLPLYLTEFGWNAPPGDWQQTVDELTKARYCVRSQILCTVRNVDKLVYFCGKWTGGPGYVVVNDDNTPRPVYAAYAAFLREFSTVKGGGQWLRLAPDVHWTAVEREGETLAAVWTGNDKIIATLPALPAAARDMMGKNLTPADRMEFSPSPTYLNFKDRFLLNIASLPVKKLLPGDRVAFPDIAVVPPHLDTDNTNIIIPENAPLGQYTVLLRRNEKIIAQPLEVIQPLEIVNNGVFWNGGKDRPKLLFKIRSLIPNQVTASVEALDLRQTITLPSGVWRTVSFDINNLVPGKRYSGNASVAITQPISRNNKIPFDTTMITSPVFAVTPPNTAWTQIPAIDFTGWQTNNPFSARNDCSGKIQTFCAPDGFHLRIEVADDQHRQADLWQDMWKEDSIQVAFDVDADKEWQPNNVGNGLNGHRVIEYMLGLGQSKTKVMGWCPLSYLNEIKSGPAFDLMKTTSIRRDEERKITVYDAVFAWRLLGLDKMPQPGKYIGFSLTVNDKDDNRQRRTMSLFGGIADGKDPLRYGKLLLVPAK